MKHTYIIIAVAALATPAAAQQAYTLGQCKEMAVAHNIAMTQASNAISQAKEASREALTKFFPTVSAQGMAFDLNRSLIDMNIMGRIPISLVKDGWLAGVNAVQPVFAGGEIINANKLARLGVKVSETEREQSAHTTSLTAETYFYQVVALKEKAKTLATLDRQLKAISKDVGEYVKAGIAQRNDLMQVQLRENDVESQQANLDNNLKLAKMLLAQYIGLGTGEADADFSLSDSLPQFPLALRKDHEAALAATPEYRLLEQNVEGQKIRKRLAVGANLPKVAVGAGYNSGDAVNNSTYNRGLVFATVNVPISGWWGGSHSIRRGQLAVENARQQMKDRSELLVINMQRCWNDVENAYKQLAIAHKSIAQSGENLRLNNDYYRAGTSSMTDLMAAETQYQQSRDKYVDAYIAYLVSITRYRQATNQE